MILAPRALNIMIDFSKLQRRDKGVNSVIMPVNICQEVYNTYIMNDFHIEFIDMDHNFNPNISDAKVHLDKCDNKLFIYNHTYGNELTPRNQLIKLKKKYKNLVIIDDRCLCMPFFEIFDKINYADLVVFSTGAKKQCDLGTGGIGILNRKNQLDSTELYYNFCDHNYLSKVKQKIIASNLLKNNNIKILKRHLSPKLRALSKEFNNWRYHLLIKNRDEVLQELFRKNLFASKHYALLDKAKQGSYKNAEFLQSFILNIFIDHYTDEEMIIEVAQTINQYANPL